MLVLPGIPWNTLELPRFHALIDSLTFFVTWEPNQVIEKIVLCLDQSLPLSQTDFSILLSQSQAFLLQVLI